MAHHSMTGTWKDFVQFPSELTKNVLAGTLHRQDAGFFSLWKKRYFKLEGDKLYWFHTSTDLEHLGFINLHDILQVGVRQHLKQGEHQLELKLKTRSMYLSFSTDEEMEHWLEGLKAWVRYFRQDWIHSQSLNDDSTSQLVLDGTPGSSWSSVRSTASDLSMHERSEKRQEEASLGSESKQERQLLDKEGVGEKEEEKRGEGKGKGKGKGKGEEEGEGEGVSESEGGSGSVSVSTSTECNAGGDQGRSEDLTVLLAEANKRALDLQMELAVKCSKILLLEKLLEECKENVAALQKVALQDCRRIADLEAKVRDYEMKESKDKVSTSPPSSSDSPRTIQYNQPLFTVTSDGNVKGDCSGIDYYNSL